LLRVSRAFAFSREDGESAVSLYEGEIRKTDPTALKPSVFFWYAGEGQTPGGGNSKKALLGHKKRKKKRAHQRLKGFELEAVFT